MRIPDNMHRTEFMDKYTELDINLIGKYVKGETTPEEEREILLWLEQSEENVRFFSEVASNMALHSRLMDESSDDDIEAVISRLTSRIDSVSGRKPESDGRRYVWRTACVALVSAAAAVGAVFLFHPLFRGQEPVCEPQYPTVCTNTSTATKSIVLEDDTRVFLKPGSEIRYDVSSLADRRLLEIKGEAYFDVSHDAMRPFTVKTRDISVSVLGTAFTVSSRPENTCTEVMLERGSVRLLSPDGTPLLKMVPNQKATYFSSDGDIMVEERPAYADIAAEYRIVSLEEVTLAQITESISSIFGVKVILAQGDRQQKPGKKYFFKYLRTDSLNDVVSAAEHLTGAKLRVER